MFQIAFVGEIISWRGPAPFLFIRTPPDVTVQIKELSRSLTYGWGCIPVKATIGSTTFTTSLFPRDGDYMVPVKVLVQKAEGVGLADVVSVSLSFGFQEG